MEVRVSKRETEVYNLETPKRLIAFYQTVIRVFVAGGKYILVFSILMPRYLVYGCVSREKGFLPKEI